MSLPPNIFLDKLQRDLNDVGIENVTFALITNLYHKFCFFFQTSVKPHKHQVKQLADCCIVYMECIRNYVVNTATLQQRQVEAVKKFIQLVETIPNLEGVRNYFMQNIATAILQTVTDPEIQVWFGKEVLRSFTSAVQHTNNDLRNNLAKENILYLCKLMDLLSTCGDYEYELILMETVFRLCSDTQISNYASTLFPECEMLQKAICDINRNHFDRDLRVFLNSVNSKSKKVLSIKCDFVFLENIEVAAPKDHYGDQLPFWVDFNTGSKTVTFKCDRDSLRTVPPNSTDDSAGGEWETVTVEFSNVKKVLMSRLLMPVTGHAQGSILFFSLAPPCGVLYSSSFEAARAAHLKLAIYQCPELLQLETEILFSMYGDKLQNLMPSSQDSSNSQPKQKRKKLIIGTGHTKPAYKPLKTRKVSMNHAKSMDGVSSVSDAMSLKNRLLESEVNTMPRRERSPVCKSPVIRSIEELQEAAAEVTSNENKHMILENYIEDVCDDTEIIKPSSKKTKITLLSKDKGVLKNEELDNTNSSLFRDATLPLDLNTTRQSVGSLSDLSEILELSKDKSVQQNHDSFIKETSGFNPEDTNDIDDTDILPATENFESIVEKTDTNNENVSVELDSKKKKPAKEIIKVKWPKYSMSLGKVLKQKKTFKSPVRGEKTPKSSRKENKKETDIIEKIHKLYQHISADPYKGEVQIIGDVGQPSESEIQKPKRAKKPKIQAKQTKSVQKQIKPLHLGEEESNVIEDTKAEKVSKTLDNKSDKLELQRSKVIVKGDVGKPTESVISEVQRGEVDGFEDETNLAPKESKSKCIKTSKIQTNTPKTENVQKQIKSLNLGEEESNVIEDTKAEKVSKTMDKKSDKLELQRSEEIAKGDVGKPTESEKTEVHRDYVYDFVDETEMALQIAPKENKSKCIKTSKIQTKETKTPKTKSVQKKKNLEEEESNVIEDTKAEKVSKAMVKKSDKLELQRSEVIAKGDVGKPTGCEKTEVQRDYVYDFVDETESALQIAPKESKSKCIKTSKIQTKDTKTPKTKSVQKKKNLEDEESNVIEDTKAEVSKIMDKKSDKLELQRSEEIAKGDVGKPTESEKTEVQRDYVYDFVDETESALQIAPKESKSKCIKTSKIQTKETKTPKTKSVQKKKNLEDEESNVIEDTKAEVSKIMDKKSDKLELQRSEEIAKGDVGKPTESEKTEVQRDYVYDFVDETESALQIAPKESKSKCIKTSKIQTKETKTPKTKSVQKKKNLEDEESNVIEDTKAEVSKIMDKKSDKLELQRSEEIAKGDVGKPTESEKTEVQRDYVYDFVDETESALQIAPKESKSKCIKTSKIQTKETKTPKTKSVQKKKNLEEEESNVIEDTKAEKVSKTMDKKSDKLELQRSGVIAKGDVGKLTESEKTEVQRDYVYDFVDETESALQIAPKESKSKCIKTSKIQTKETKTPKTKSVQKKKNLEEEESNVIEDTKAEKVPKTMDKKSEKLELQRSEVIAKGDVGKPTESEKTEIQRDYVYDFVDETESALQIAPTESKSKTSKIQTKETKTPKTKSVQKKKNLEEGESNVIENTKAEVSKTMDKESDKLELQRSKVIAKVDVGKPTKSVKSDVQKHEVYDFEDETELALQIGSPKERKTKTSKHTKIPKTKSVQKKNNLEKEESNVTEDTKREKVSKAVDSKSDKPELQRVEVVVKGDVGKPTESAQLEVQTGEVFGFEDEALQIGAPKENKPKETKTPKTKSVQKQKKKNLEEEESNLIEDTKAKKVSVAMDSKFNKSELQTSEVVVKRDLGKPTESVKADVQTGEVIGFEDEALQIGAPNESKSKCIKKTSKIQTKETKTPKISVRKQKKKNLEEEESSPLEDIIAWKIPKVIDGAPEPPMIKAKEGKSSKDGVKVTKQKRSKSQIKEKKPSKSHKKESLETIPSKLQLQEDAEPILLQTRSSELHVKDTLKSVKSKLTTKKRGKNLMDTEDEQPQAGTSVFDIANDESSVDKPVLTVKKGRIYDLNETASEDVINIQPNVPSEILTNSPKNIYPKNTSIPFDEGFLPELKKHTAIVMSQESDDIFLEDFSPKPQAHISVTVDVINNKVELCSPPIHEKRASQSQSQQKQSQEDLFDACFKGYLDEIESTKATKQSHAEVNHQPENYEVRKVPDSKDVHQMDHDEKVSANNCVNELDTLQLPKIPEDEFQNVRQSDNVNEEETKATPKIKILYIHLIRSAFDKEELKAQAEKQNKKYKSTTKRKSNKKEALDTQLSPHKSPPMNDDDKYEKNAEKGNKQLKLEEPKSSKQKLNKKNKSTKTAIMGNKPSDLITTWQKATEEITNPSLPDLLKDAEIMETNIAKNTIENKQVKKTKEESNLKLVAEFDQDNDPEIFNKSTQELQEEIDFSESNFEKSNEVESSKKRKHSESNLDEPLSKNFKPVDNRTPTTIKKSKKLPRRRLFNPNTIYVVNESTATDKSNSLQQTLLSDDLEPLLDDHREEVQAPKSAVSLEIEEDGSFDRTTKSLYKQPVSTIVRQKNADKHVGIPQENKTVQEFKSVGIPQENKTVQDFKSGEIPQENKTVQEFKRVAIPQKNKTVQEFKRVGIPQENKTVQEFNLSTADKYLKDKQHNFSSSHEDNIQIENHKNKTDLERPHIPLKPYKKDIQKTTTTELPIKKSKPQVDQRRDSVDYYKKRKTVEYDNEFPVCHKRTSLVDYVFGDFEDSSTDNEYSSKFDLCLRSICENLDKASAIFSHPKLKKSKNKSKKYRSLSPGNNKDQKPKRKYTKLCGDKSKQQKLPKKIKKADAKSLIKQSKPLSKNRNERDFEEPSEIECHTSKPQNSINDLLTTPVWQNKPSKKAKPGKKRSSDDYHPVPPQASILESMDDLIQNQIHSGTVTVSVEKLKSLIDLIVQHDIQLYNILLQIMTPIKNNPQQDFSKTVVILNKLINLLNTYPKK